MLFEDGVEGDHGGVDLRRDGRMSRGFQDDLEGLRPGAGGGAEHADVALANDTVAGGEVIDATAAVAGQNGGGGTQGGGQDMDGVGGAKGKAVEAVAGVVGVQGEVAVEIQLADVVFQDPDLKLVGGAPELPVQVETRTIVAGAVGLTGGVADGVEENLVTAGELGPGHQFAEEPNGGQGAGDLIPVNPGKDAEPVVGVTALGAQKTKAGQKVGLGEMVPVDELVGT